MRPGAEGPSRRRRRRRSASRPETPVSRQVFLGFIDDVLDVPWRVKLARPPGFRPAAPARREPTPPASPARLLAALRRGRARATLRLRNPRKTGAKPARNPAGAAHLRGAAAAHVVRRPHRGGGAQAPALAAWRGARPGAGGAVPALHGETPGADSPGGLHGHCAGCAAGGWAAAAAQYLARNPGRCCCRCFAPTRSTSTPASTDWRRDRRSSWRSRRGSPPGQVPRVRLPPGQVPRSHGPAPAKPAPGRCSRTT